MTDGDAHAGASSAAVDAVMVGGPVGDEGELNELGLVFWAAALLITGHIVGDVEPSSSMVDDAQDVSRIGFARETTALRVLITPLTLATVGPPAQRTTLKIEMKLT